MKKTKFLIISFFAFLLIIPFTAQAFEIKSDDFIFIAEDEIIDGNLYAAGTSISVDGTVTGDVICAGQTININGTVEGDVICAGQSLNINGTVNGNARMAGNAININGTVARNVMAFGATINLGKDGQVGWDMLIAGATGEIRGKVGRDLYGGAASVVIAGEIGKDVRLETNNKDATKGGLTIVKGATIGGNVIYKDKNEASIAEGASIVGEITHNMPKIKKAKKDIARVWAWGRLYSIFSALVIGLVLVSLWREQINKLTDKMLDKAGASIGWGVVVMFITPIIFIILLITLIGIPLAFLLIGAWAIALFISKILVGILVGRSILDKFWKKQKDSLIWAMIIGIIITYMIYSLPLVGWLFCLVAIWWGLGGIWLYFRKA